MVPANLSRGWPDLAWNAGVQGFVSSGQECAALRAQLGREAYIVTPGIRPASASTGDQRRVVTPASAIHAGSNLLVVGRPIRDASDPADAAHSIVREIAAALQR